MVSLVLYIQNERVDLFPDETVSITETIQNVRDVGKVFTDFTKTFSLPASPNNNRLFKHYYNFNIENGFDARIRVDATLELNLLPFKKGKLKLEGTQLKNGKISNYKVTFFGDTIELKDKFREEKLNAFNLSQYNKDYTTANIKADLQADPTANDVIVPLITHTERLVYDSTPTTESGNLFPVAASNRGVLWSELKYALRVDAIIRAIEDKYTLTFSNDFFTSSNAPYYNLFMWTHRKKGNVESPSGTNNTETYIDGWSDDSDEFTRSEMRSSTLILTGNNDYDTNRITTTTASGVNYSVTVYKNGSLIYDSGLVSGSQVINLATINIGGFTNGSYTAYITSEASISFTQIAWFVQYTDDDDIQYNYNYNTGAYTNANTFVFDFAQQIPEIKVIDFLTGLFKMFNLTAYFNQDNGEIVVDTLDNYYSGGTEYEIDKYVDVTSHDVNVALPYKQINFTYEGLGTFLAETHDQLFNFKWGEENWNGDEDLDGEVYDVTLPFEHMKFEKLIDSNTGTQTDVMYGYFVDDNQDSYLGEPLLFYPVRVTGGTSISFRDTTITQSTITTYNVPSNSLALDVATSTVNIHFKPERNEYDLDAGNSFDGTLFNEYYRSYITDVFNKKNRLSIYQIRLPLRILLQLTLADRLIIRGNKYKINSITTNLNTLDSTVELLNDFS